MTAAEMAVFMREHKILHMKTPDGFEMSLHPDALAPEKIDDQKEDPKEKELGATGLTRAQMRELFNQTFEEDFQKSS